MKNPNALKWSDLRTGIFFIIGIGFAAYLGGLGLAVIPFVN